MEAQVGKVNNLKSLQRPLSRFGARSGPPEDSGGVWGYGDKLEILADPKHPDYEEILDWIGPSFDPERFDRDAVNKRLQKMTAPRKKRSRKSP